MLFLILYFDPFVIEGLCKDALFYCLFFLYAEPRLQGIFYTIAFVVL